MVGGIELAEVHNMALENVAVVEDEDEAEEMCSMEGSIDLLAQALAAVEMLPSRPF